MRFLIVCPLVFLAGFVDALAGGGGLISLPAYLLSGLPVHLALGTNKLSSFCGTCLTTWSYTKKKYIQWTKDWIFIPLALGGSFLGARLALAISPEIFRIILLVIVPVSAIYILRSKSLDDKKPALPVKKAILIIGLTAFGIGMYDGFYGPGTGTFIILLLTSLAHLSLQRSNGIAKVINVSTNFAALGVWIFSGNVDWLLGGTAALFSIAGNWFGSRAFESNAQKLVKPCILIVLLLLMIRLVTELF